MSELSYGDIHDPGTWCGADLRRHQISQLLHVITPAAAMCIILSSSPEAMFPPVVTVATWTGWPWNLLLAMAFGVLAWDVRALLLRRRRRGPLTFPFDSVPQAFLFAEEALSVSRRSLSPGGYVGPRTAAVGVWETYAVLPLAALAYAASQSPRVNAMEWLARTVTALTSVASDDAWREAAHAVAAADSTLHQSFVRTMSMEQRQRDSVALVMRDALAPYMAVRR